MIHILKKTIVLVLILIGTIDSYAALSKIKVSCSESKVDCLYNNKWMGIDKKTLRIDFNQVQKISFHKEGFLSYVVELDPDDKITTIEVKLIPRPKKGSLNKSAKLLPLEEVAMRRIVTNFDSSDIRALLIDNFQEEKFYLGKTVAEYPDLMGQLSETNSLLKVEVIDSDQVKSMFRYPKFMMSTIKLRFILLDKTTGKIKYAKNTSNTYFVRFMSTNKLNLNEKSKQIMHKAFRDAQVELISDPNFTKFL